MHNDLISVIIPVYNAEKYVEKSVKSVIEQTYKNLEIIIVDDGSLDKSREICEKLAIEDKRIKLIHKENGGASDARNYGLSNSSGKYICFVDSDDYASADFVEKLYDALNKEDADISACNYYTVEVDGTLNSREKVKTKKNYSNIEALQDMFSCERELDVVLWNKLFKKELFTQNNVVFPVGEMYEDAFTIYKLFYYSKKITLIPDKLYYYLQTENSVMRRKFNEKKLGLLRCLKETKEFLDNNDCEELIPYYNVYSFSLKRSLINNMILDDYDINEIMKLRKELKSELRKVLLSKYIDTKMKIKISILSINYKLFLKLFYRNKR